MKATGIVRRIDDLGRVIIPKEIRRTMRINVGDPLEIFTDRDGSVIFKKYSPSNLTEVSLQIIAALHAMHIRAHVLDNYGDCLDNPTVPSVDLDDSAHEPFLFVIKDNEGCDIWGYVYVCGGAPNEFQKAQIEGVIAMALTNL